MQDKFQHKSFTSYFKVTVKLTKSAELTIFSNLNVSDILKNSYTARK